MSQYPGLTRKADAVMSRIHQRRRLAAPEACRRLRQRAGLTQDEMAEALDVDRATISRWETGDRRPRGKHLEEYTELLDRIAVEVAR